MTANKNTIPVEDQNSNDDEKDLEFFADEKPRKPKGKKIKKFRHPGEY